MKYFFQVNLFIEGDDIFLTNGDDIAIAELKLRGIKAEILGGTPECFVKAELDERRTFMDKGEIRLK